VRRPAPPVDAEVVRERAGGLAVTDEQIALTCQQRRAQVGDGFPEESRPVAAGLLALEGGAPAKLVRPESVGIEDVDEEEFIGAGRPE
jgi:hypothetical protein